MPNFRSFVLLLGADTRFMSQEGTIVYELFTIFEEGIFLTIISDHEFNELD